MMNKMAVKWEDGPGKAVVVCDTWEHIMDACDQFYEAGARRLVLETVVDVKPGEAHHIDVTRQISYGDVDGEDMPITKCVCGANFELWGEIVGVYKDRPWICPHCGAKLYFVPANRVMQIVENTNEKVA